MVSDLNEISRGLDKFALLRLAPVIEAGNYLNRPPREGDVFDRSSLGDSRAKTRANGGPRSPASSPENPLGYIPGLSTILEVG